MATAIQIGVAAGEYMEDVVVIEWAAAEGDPVKQGDLVVTVETAKAASEVEAPCDGILSKIFAPVGAEVPVSEVLGFIGRDSSDIGPDTEESSAAVLTDDSDPNSTQTTVLETEQAAPVEIAQASESDDRGVCESLKRIIASPAARRLATARGIDLRRLSASSSTGRIKLRDVELASITEVPVTAADRDEGSLLSDSVSSDPVDLVPGSSVCDNTGLSIPVIPEIDFSRFGEIERVEMSRIRRLSATNLHRAWLNLPMVTHHDEADITDLETFRQELKAQAADGEPRLTGLAFHIKALVQALRAFPKFNSSLSPDGQAIIYKKYFHVAIAVDTPDGLVVPVIRNANIKSLRELAAEMIDIGERARARKLKSEEMQGACMTISSLGGIGGTAFTPIVNPPEVAILGITRARMQPIWNGNEFVPRLMCPLDLSYDHRVVDGADAARFMVYYCKTIGDIRRLML